MRILAELEGDEATTVIAERDGQATGFVVISSGWLRSLFVRASEWGRGAGSALHDEAVRLLEAEGAGASLWVLEENEQARAFYEHRGWRHGESASGRPTRPTRRCSGTSSSGSPLRVAASGPIPNPHPPGDAARG